MHLTILAYGTWGDVYPSLQLGRELSNAGYEITLALSEDFEPLAQGSGLDLHLFPVDKHRMMENVSSETNPLRVAVAVRRHMVPALLQAAEELRPLSERTDALLSNEWLLAPAAAAARLQGIQLLRLSMKPNLPTATFPIPTMPNLPGWLPLRKRYNRGSYRLARFFRWITHVRPLARQSPLGGNTHLATFHRYLRLIQETPSITLVSPHVVPRPVDWKPHHRLTGYLHYKDEDWKPPTDLERFLDGGDPPVYVGFGSMHDAEPDETTRRILGALELAGVRAVLYSGWAGLGTLDLPPAVYRLDYAPHGWLFPRMAAVVHHAGAGTTAAALRAGVPSIAVPHSGDQPFWAWRVHQLGAGSEPLPKPRLTSTGLSEQITATLEDRHLRRTAASLGERLRVEKGGARTVAAIDDFLCGPEAPRHIPNQWM